MFALSTLSDVGSAPPSTAFDPSASSVAPVKWAHSATDVIQCDTRRPSDGAPHPCDPPKDHPFTKWLDEMLFDASKGSEPLFTASEMATAHKNAVTEELADWVAENEKITSFSTLAKAVSKKFALDHHMTSPTSADSIMEQSERIQRSLVLAITADAGEEIKSKTLKEGRRLSEFMDWMCSIDATAPKEQVDWLALEFEGLTNAFTQRIGDAA